MSDPIMYRGVTVPGYVARNIDSGTFGARWFRRGVDAVLDAQEAKRAAVEAAKPKGPAFSAWPKTPRLFRDVTVTEKLDGTNAAIHIQPVEDSGAGDFVVQYAGQYYAIAAQSRKRLIRPGADNFGFAAWVHANATELVSILGPGLHFGEWWGQGIQRGYGLGERRFSLFNTHKWSGLNVTVGAVVVDTPPILYQGPLDTAAVAGILDGLREFGSAAAPGFATPEGVCVYVHSSRQVYKATLDANDAGKWEHNA